MLEGWGDVQILFLSDSWVAPIATFFGPPPRFCISPSFWTCYCVRRWANTGCNCIMQVQVAVSIFVAICDFDLPDHDARPPGHALCNRVSLYQLVLRVVSHNVPP